MADIYTGASVNRKTSLYKLAISRPFCLDFYATQMRRSAVKRPFLNEIQCIFVGYLVCEIIVKN